ncbi:Uncharacterised protein [Mycobacteroides abscessus subsp. abscessus]|nr:Uncharacterised protein [Mycobacteroides abscessus subsp. abscessus]
MSPSTTSTPRSDAVTEALPGIFASHVGVFSNVGTMSSVVSTVRSEAASSCWSELIVCGDSGALVGTMLGMTKAPIMRIAMPMRTRPGTVRRPSRRCFLPAGRFRAGFCLGFCVGGVWAAGPEYGVPSGYSSPAAASVDSGARPASVPVVGAGSVPMAAAGAASTGVSEEGEAPLAEVVVGSVS